MKHLNGKQLRISVIAGVGILLIAVSSSCDPKNTKFGKSISSANGSRMVIEQPSQICLECHEYSFNEWKQSDHANANRLYTREIFGDAFSVHRYHTVGNQVSEFYEENGKPVIKTMGSHGYTQAFTPEMVLANNPMLQYMIPFEDGRWQVTELAWDIHKNEWFNVYGEEQRRSEEWGHWSRRGMNWNAQCAICHTSYYSKNYDLETDRYASHWKEMGISCQQCHGEMPEHLLKPEEPLLESESVSTEDYLESCYSCHSRREDLTGNFRIGDDFDDHHRIQLPVSDRYYFPDGQIKDEVFVYGSFLMSKMYDKGVRCLDCHNPHSLKLKLPVENNELCMLCHLAPGINNAKPIDPLAHGHHEEGSEGNRCVECHMRERTYMALDPRRDHGFHTPDPMMSEEFNLPNACSACHESEGLNWVKNAFEDWYGESDNIKEKRHHIRVVSGAMGRDLSVYDDMVRLLQTETSPMWKGALIQLLMVMEPSEATLKLIRSFLNDPSPIVRGAVVQSFSNLPGFDGILRPMLDDSSRLVRLDASWYLRNELEPESILKKELLNYMKYTADQPGGALRWANYYLERGEGKQAEAWMTKVVEWDKTSSAARLTQAFMLNQIGKPMQAIESFEKAFELNPTDVEPLFYQAILHAEQSGVGKAKEAFERVIAEDPLFDRAWYNLALIFSQEGADNVALNYLDQAISLNKKTPDYLYAKATILLRQGDFDGARAVISEVFELDPNYGPAQQFKQMME